MNDLLHDPSKRAYRTAGWVSIFAGVVGLAAFGFIVSALFIRTDARRLGALMFRWHDAMAVLQSFCMLVVVTGLYWRAKQSSKPLPTFSYHFANVVLGILILVLLLTLTHTVNDMLYMIPQGLFGLWIIWLGFDQTGLMPRHVKWLGIFAGLGLTLIGIFPVIFGIFVDPIVFLGPMPPDYQDVNNTANLVAHIILGIGTLIGLPLYPVWSIAVGRMLLRSPARTGGLA